MALRHTAILASATVFVACGMFANTSSAASLVIDNDIVVTAPRAIQKQDLGRSNSGAPIEQVSLSRTVPYRDLDLTRVNDVRILDDRIMFTAKEACEQLNKLYPSATYPILDANRDCYKDAVKEAMKQKNMLVGVR